MVGLALRLRLALLRGSLRPGAGSTARRVGFFVGLAGGVLLALLGFGLLAVLSGQQQADAATLLFAVLLAGWLVLPILTASSDELLDPSRLALLPLTRRDLITVLGVGALVGVAPVATLLACLGLVVGAASAGAAAVAAVSAALMVALCVCASRLLAVLLSGLLRSRRGRDIGVAVTATVALLPQLANLTLQRELRTADASALTTFARPLRLLPTGLLATAPQRVAEGRTGAALAGLALVAGLVVLLVAAWQAAVARSLVTVDRTTSTARIRHRNRWLPGRVGAVAGKDLRYLRRDPRRLVALFSLLPLLAVLTLGPAFSFGGGLSRGSVFVVAVFGLIGALLTANRFGADGTATWLVVAALGDRRQARRDLLGGDLAAATVLLPLLLAAALALGLVTGAGTLTLAAVGLALALFGVGLGAAALTSVLAAYPVPERTTSAFAGNGTGGVAFLSSMGQLFGVPLLCLPLLPLLLLSLHSGAAAVALLVVGAAYGAGVGALLRELAARRWLASAPDVLQRLVAGRT